jgi:hypothetical protein
MDSTNSSSYALSLTVVTARADKRSSVGVQEIEEEEARSDSD